MIRSLLVGVLAVSALAACSGDTAAPVVKPGVAAGEVLEVSGTVTATRGGTTRDLVTGDEVSGDDTIKTGPDGRIAILVDHNRARWELGASKTAVVSGSLAWTAARQAGAGGASDEDTLAAGRHAEKTGADTGATALAPGQPAQAAPTPAPKEAAQAAPTPAPKEAAQAVAPPAAEPTADRAPPAQPPAPGGLVAPVTPRDQRVEDSKTPNEGGLGPRGSSPDSRGTGTATLDLGTMGTRGGGAGAGYGAGAGASGRVTRNKGTPESAAVATGALPKSPRPAPPPPPPVPPVTPTLTSIQAAIQREHDAIARCLGDRASLEVQVVVTAGKLRFELGAGVPTALSGCLGAIAVRLRFDPTAASVKAPLTLTK